MVLGKFPVPGRPTVSMIVGQGLIALAIGAGGDVWSFLLFAIFSLLSPSLFLSFSHRAVNPKQPTNLSRRRPDID